MKTIGNVENLSITLFFCVIVNENRATTPAILWIDSTDDFDRVNRNSSPPPPIGRFSVDLSKTRRPKHTIYYARALRAHAPLLSKKYKSKKYFLLRIRVCAHARALKDSLGSLSPIARRRVRDILRTSREKFLLFTICTPFLLGLTNPR